VRRVIHLVQGSVRYVLVHASIFQASAVAFVWIDALGDRCVMAEDPENLILAFPRRLDAKMDAMAHDVGDVRQRLATLEIAVANLAATQASRYANLALRIDRLEARVARIETRLDLVEPV
jgi:hypothetical protein